MAEKWPNPPYASSVLQLALPLLFATFILVASDLFEKKKPSLFLPMASIRVIILSATFEMQFWEDVDWIFTANLLQSGVLGEMAKWGSITVYNLIFLCSDIVCDCLCTVVDRTLVATCKDSIGWMFSKLDTNNDLYLDQAELAAINLDKYEVCIRPFFNSCDSYHDGKVSTAEWCLCFWRESEFSVSLHDWT